MNIRRLRLLAGIVQEAVSTDPAVNQHIERVLADFAPSEQTEILDALEIVQRSGEQGTAVEDWGRELAQIYVGSSINLKGILHLLRERFGFCVRMDQRRLTWIEDRVLASVTPKSSEPTTDNQAKPVGGLMRDLANSKV